MSLTLGYKIPGSSRGGVFTVPDDCHGLVADSEVNCIAGGLRSSGKEPSWQAVRGAVLKLARSRRIKKNKEIQHDS